MELSIRRAKFNEVTTLVSIYHDAYSENEVLGLPASASRVETKEVGDWITNTILLIAEDVTTNNIVGTVRLKYNEEWNCYVLGRLAVKSLCKGLGIGSKLMQQAEKELLSLGEERVRLTVAQNHPYLPIMYQRKGYNIVDHRILLALPYNEYIMEKSL